MRFSRDLDYFHDSETRVAEAFTADRGLLDAGGYSIDVDLNQPGFVRAIVSKGSHVTKVEWARDSAWRFMPTVKDPRVGFVLHPVDLAVNKVLALAGRDEPRDVLDTLHLHRYVSGARSSVLGGVRQGPRIQLRSRSSISCADVDGFAQRTLQASTSPNQSISTPSK